MSKPTVLMILDGWGVNVPYAGNAVHHANTPYFDKLTKEYKTTVLNASEDSVGLPSGVFGNSEVGHITLGAGRILYQDLLRINKSIDSGDFFENQAFKKAIDHVKKNNSKLHLMGLVSDGCVHSSDKHLFALLELAKKSSLDQVFVHAFLDGRDTPHNSGVKYIDRLETKMAELGIGKIATVTGRFWSMDRDNNWQRVSVAYQALTAGEGDYFNTAQDGILDSYNKDVYDEEIKPIIISPIDNNPVGTIEANDAVIFFNYRSDRAREITRVFTDRELQSEDLIRKNIIDNLCFVTFTQYKSDLNVEVAFPPQFPINTLGQIIADNNLNQLRIAETEKYAHVTYFFNGGKESQFLNEDRILVASPKVNSYSECPEMSALEITEKLVAAINSNKYDFILVNYANADMVGHTGSIDSAIKAIEIVDHCLQQVCEAVLVKGGEVLVTADHGNADEMLSPDGHIAKEHSINLVPFILVGERFIDHKNSDVLLHELKPTGGLADIAPTVLSLMNLNKPGEMTGKSLL